MTSSMAGRGRRDGGQRGPGACSPARARRDPRWEGPLVSQPHTGPRRGHIGVACSAQRPRRFVSLSGSAERVVVGVGEGCGELVHRQGGRLVVGPRPVRVHGHGDGIGERRGVLGQVGVLPDGVVRVPLGSLQGEGGRARSDGAAGGDGDAAGHHEAPHDLPSRPVPEPVAGFEVNSFHTETGYWLWDGSTGEIVRCFVVPRGIAVTAGGTVAAGATSFTLEAAKGHPYYAIGENAYLAEHASTLAYTVTVTVNPDGSWSYDETTTLAMDEFATSFAHTDHNTLRRAG